MSLYTEIQQAIADVLAKHGETTDETDALPQTLDELKASTPTIQSEFAAVLQAEASKLNEQRHD